MSKDFSRPQGSALFTGFRALVNRLLDSFGIWNRRRLIEAELYALSPHMLEDIGVERGEISAVASGWARAAIERDRAERFDRKAGKSGAVAPFTPETTVSAPPASAANDHGHSVAA